MTREKLVEEIQKKKSFLCIGLDTDIDRIPSHLLQFPDPVFEFNKQIIDATHDLCVAYKINTAFYESRGIDGWKSMTRTLHYIPNDIFTIADAKRGDIGNTSKMYAKAFFETADFDSITVAPYMGIDSVSPFLSFEGKWVILLALTSNEGAKDFQYFNDGENNLFEHVLKTSKSWGDNNNMMYVVGATKAEKLKSIRQIIPDHFLLVPGVGAQGGSLAEVIEGGINQDIGLLVNSSRAIIYASSNSDFDVAARSAAKSIQKIMSMHF